MPGPRALAKRMLRASLRRMVPFVSNRPWLVGLASRTFATMPSLKRRLRVVLAGPPQAIAHEDFTPAQAAVFSDLRQAVRDSQQRAP